MRKLFLLISIFFILHSDVYALDISAKSAVLLDCGSGRILFEKNSDEKLPMASTTKIMTGLLACESGKMKKTVTVSPYASGTEGSSLWLEPGENQTLEDLTYGLLLRSGNDSAVAIAEFLGGSVDAFAILMTKRAREIGALNTSFKNPHGLDAEGHFTTAKDLGLITCTAMKNKKFAKIASTKNKTIPWESSKWDRSLKNHNKLLWRYEGCNGVKTGFTKKSGRCLVSSARRGHLSLVCVTLNAPDDWNDHSKLLDYGYENYRAVTVCKKGKKWASLKISKKKKLPIVCKETFTIAVSPNERIATEEEYKKIGKEIKKGEKIGTLKILIDDKEAGTVDLISYQTYRKII